VSGLLKVLSRVRVFGRITAAGVAAGEAQANLHPRVARLLAILATLGMWHDIRVGLIQVRAFLFFFCHMRSISGHRQLFIVARCLCLHFISKSRLLLVRLILLFSPFLFVLSQAIYTRPSLCFSLYVA
jgi:hypothetical protein